MVGKVIQTMHAGTSRDLLFLARREQILSDHSSRLVRYSTNNDGGGLPLMSYFRVGQPTSIRQNGVLQT